MNARAEAETLRARATAFLENAKHLLVRGGYDLASFNAEQAAQLYCKAALLEVTGDYPRTHSTVELLMLLAQVGHPRLEQFVSANRGRLRLLETAYITARYYAIKFMREEAASLITAAEHVIRGLPVPRAPTLYRSARRSNARCVLVRGPP